VNPLERLRKICLALPEAIETTTFGHPTFQAGPKKTFAVLDDAERAGALCIVFKAAVEVQRELVDDETFFPCKFGARHGWTSAVVGRGLDWKLIEKLLVESYRLVASKRMGAALDAKAAGRRRRPSTSGMPHERPQGVPKKA
jgi:predicted DNA-binding protein (MmcQ/YjbR family)